MPYTDLQATIEDAYEQRAQITPQTRSPEVGNAVETVVAEVTGRAAGRRPRSRDELLELIRAHGALTHAEIEERVGENARAMLAELAAEQRMASINLREGDPFFLGSPFLVREGGQGVRFHAPRGSCPLFAN